MKITIIPKTGSVYKDNVAYNDLVWDGTPPNVHALQWFGSNGWIEYLDYSPNTQIDILPDWANNALTAWDQAQAESQNVPTTAEDNKNTASQLLYATDWTTIFDVSDPTKSNPYLSNVNEFLVYRNAVRQYAINPVAGQIDWPVVPTAQWADAGK
jgi:hypothetical protein